MNSIVTGARNEYRPSTIKISSVLRKWLKKRARADLVAPWRFGKRLWRAPWHGAVPDGTLNEVTKDLENM